jgi:hypothetical protein
MYYKIVEIYGENEDHTLCPEKALALHLGKAATPISDYVLVEDPDGNTLYEYGVTRPAKETP